MNKHAISALALFFINLWGGAYFLHALGTGWWDYPLRITLIVFGLISFILALSTCGLSLEESEELEFRHRFSASDKTKGEV